MTEACRTFLKNQGTFKERFARNTPWGFPNVTAGANQPMLTSCGDTMVADLTFLDVRHRGCRLVYSSSEKGYFVNRTSIMLLLGSLLLPTLAHAEMMSVGVDKANFREGPSTGHEVFYTAEKLFPVEVIRCEGGWCKTRDFEGDVAWVSKDLLVSRRTVVVTVPRGNVREGPSFDSELAFSIERGDGALWLGEDGSWLQVRDARGQTGWIHREIAWGWERQQSPMGKTSVVNLEPSIGPAKPAATVATPKAKTARVAPALPLPTPDRSGASKNTSKENSPGSGASQGTHTNAPAPEDTQEKATGAPTARKPAATSTDPKAAEKSRTDAKTDSKEVGIPSRR